MRKRSRLRQDGYFAFSGDSTARRTHAFGPDRAVRARPADVQDAFGRHRPLPFAAGAHGRVPADRPPAGVDPHRAGGGAAPLRRPPYHARACAPAGELGSQWLAHGRDPVRRLPRRAAGFHRRAAAGRPGRDAQRSRAPEQEPEDDRAAGAGGPGGRPQRDDRRLRPQELARHQHEDRVPAQQRALQVHEVGDAGVRHVRRGAPRLRHRPPGQPRVPGARRAQAGRCERAEQGAGLLPGHAGGHRQPHHDDQRPGRGRLGRGRHRGRGRDAGPAGLFPHPGRRRFRVHRPDARRRHRHRPGAHRHRDAAQGQGGGQVRRVLRRRHGAVVGARPRHAGQHGARVRRHDGLLLRRRQDGGVHARHRPHRRGDRGLRGLLPRAGPVRHAGQRLDRLQRIAHAGPVYRHPQPGGPEAPAGSHRDRPAVEEVRRAARDPRCQ